MRKFLALVAMLALASEEAGAQRAPLPARLGAESRAVIERVIDSARTAGLPVDPLTDKVLEGVLKGADDQRINTALLGATASALHAGVSASELRRLVRPAADASADAGVLTSALVVLVDIVAKRVPTGVAVSAIGGLLQRGAPERQFTALRSAVEQDIMAGRQPETALLERARAQMRQLDADPLTSNPASRRRGPP